MEKFKIGDMIQYHDDDENIVEAEVINFHKALPFPKDYWQNPNKYSNEELDSFYDYYTVKKSDNSIVKTNYVEKIDSEIERSFREEVKRTHKEINEKIELASKHLNEAVNIAEKRGISFSSEISFISNTYNPVTKNPNKAEMSDDFLESLDQDFNLRYYGGWLHSQVC